MPGSGADVLYKVAPPRSDWMFEPRTFWRNDDWSSSTHRPRDGYVQEHVLYAAPFDEVNIHLFPKVWRLRVWLDDDERVRRLRERGFECSDDSRALLFAHAADEERIATFEPTVFAFDPAGFERVPTGEFVARTAQPAIGCETLTFDEAKRRWGFDLVFVESGEELAASFRDGRIDHQIQT